MVEDVHVTLFGWMQTLFEASALDLATRIFDGFLLQLQTQTATQFAVRVCTAILKLLAPHIDGKEFEVAFKIMSAPLDHPVWASCVAEEGALLGAIGDVSLPANAVSMLNGIMFS